MSGLTLRVHFGTLWYICFMHFGVITGMRWMLTGSRKICGLRLCRQLAEQEGLTLLLQMLGDLASMGYFISKRSSDAQAFASANKP